jgi:hypothetical protein
MNTISPGRFRLLCQEIAFKVNARQNREEATRTSVLLELLRRVERFLGERHATLAGGPASVTQSITERLDQFVDTAPGTSGSAIAETELIGRVRIHGEEEKAPPKKSSRSSGK